MVRQLRHLMDTLSLPLSLSYSLSLSLSQCSPSNCIGQISLLVTRLFYSISFIIILEYRSPLILHHPQLVLKEHIFKGFNKFPSLKCQCAHCHPSSPATGSFVNFISMPDHLATFFSKFQEKKYEFVTSFASCQKRKQFCMLNVHCYRY